MQRIDRTLTIKAPPHTVFDYINEPANLARWWPESGEIFDLLRLHNGGSRYHWTAKVIGVHFEGICEDVEVKRHQHIVSHVTGGLHATLTWDIRQESEDAALAFSLEYGIPVALHSHSTKSIIDTIELDVDQFLTKIRTEIEFVTPLRSHSY